MATRTKEVTHKIMSAVKQKDTEPELMLRKALWDRGLRFRKNYKVLIGKPDVVFTKARIVVFCDGDFWHGHNWALRGLPSLEAELATYSEFWKQKILRNIERDKEVTDMLATNGWVVIRLWESEIRNNLTECVDRIEVEYKKRRW